MRIIFVRHAEPDYPNNSLTEKGFREAEILSERIGKWEVDRIYASPLPRAYFTAEPSAKKLGKDITKVDWMKEFFYPIIDPTTGKEHVPWDFMPEYWTGETQFYDFHEFVNHPLMKEEYRGAFADMKKGLDAILSEYGYTRKDDYFLCDEERTKDDDNKTIVIFAHLGANLEAIGYLLNISPIVLQQTIYLAPSSVSILNFEKRMPGKAMPRAQVIGSTSHLEAAGEPLSRMGAFSDVHDL